MCLCATVVACRPWLWDASLAFTVRDAGFMLVGMDWLQTAVLRGADVWATPLGWPIAFPTTLVDWTLGEALMGLPFRIAGWDPLRVHVAVVFLALLLSTWTAHRIAVALFGRGPHTWTAGVGAGLGPLQLAHAQHLNLVQHQLALGAALLLAGGLVRGSPGLALAGGLLAGGAAHFGAYMGLHAAMVAVVTLLLGALSRAGTPRTWGAALLGLAIASATVIPVLSRYTTASTTYRMHLGLGEVFADSWDPARTFSPTPRATFHDLIPSGAGPTPLDPRDPNNPGFLLAALGVLGLAARYRPQVPVPLRWAPAAVAVFAFLLALGPVVQWNGRATGLSGPTVLLDSILDGAAFRAPSRWLAVAFSGVAVLAAGGLQRALFLVPQRARGVLGVFAVAVLLGETPRAVTGPASDVGVEPAARLLDDITGEGALYENHGPACPYEARQGFYAALFHGRPMVGGIYARAFGDIQDINRVAGSWPAVEAATFLRAVGTRVTYEHPPLRRLPEGTGRCHIADGHRICELDPQQLPAPSVVTETAAGAVIGLRWRSLPESHAVQIQCAGNSVTTFPRVWALVTRLRGGSGVDVFLDAPCPSVPTVDVGSPVPLYSTGGASWLPQPPIRPRRMVHASGVLPPG